VNEIIDFLFSKSRENNQVIVGGADNIFEGNKIYTKSPIFIPGMDSPTWIYKKRLSQWEVGFVDSATDFENPYFFWEYKEIKYRVFIKICIDFAFIFREKESIELENSLYIIPMCSPDVSTFYTYADVLLGEEGGKAILICNCKDKMNNGSSSLFSITPKGKRMQPSFDLGDKREMIACFEFDLSKMVLPRRTSIKSSPALGKLFQYEIVENIGGIDFFPLTTVEPLLEEKTRAVLNPDLFHILGKKLRMTFISSKQYFTDDVKLENCGFELYSVLGHKDLVITHLHETVERMVLDINNNIYYQLSKFTEKDGNDKFPFFEVERFHKVLGYPISESASKACQRNQPTPKEINELLALGLDWSCKTILEETRKEYHSKDWILGETKNIPGEINALMTIYLDNLIEGIAPPIQDFNKNVISQLVHYNAITSIYQGTGHRFQIHYILRIKESVEELFKLISQIHELANSKDFIISTNTFIIIKKWSKLDLNRLLLSELPVSDALYRDHVFATKIKNEDLSEMIKYSIYDQKGILDAFKDIEESLKLLKNEQWFKDKKEMIESTFAKGLLLSDYSIIYEGYIKIHSHVESIITNLVSNDNKLPFEEYSVKLEFPKGKNIKNLTYSEKLKLLIEHHKSSGNNIMGLQELYVKTVNFRNAIVHENFDKLTVPSLCLAIKAYCNFISENI